VGLGEIKYFSAASANLDIAKPTANMFFVLFLTRLQQTLRVISAAF
jgi:hypothetical protein